MQLHGKVGKKFPARANENGVPVVMHKHPQAAKVAKLNDGSEMLRNVRRAHSGYRVDTFTEQLARLVSDESTKLFRDLFESASKSRTIRNSSFSLPAGCPCPVVPDTKRVSFPCVFGDQLSTKERVTRGASYFFPPASSLPTSPPLEMLLRFSFETFVSIRERSNRFPRKRLLAIARLRPSPVPVERTERIRVAFTVLAPEEPATSRIAFKFSRTISACIGGSPLKSCPEAGSIDNCPETKTKPLALIACEYGPIAFGGRDNVFQRSSFAYATVSKTLGMVGHRANEQTAA
jgi:hypothetical protein